MLSVCLGAIGELMGIWKWRKKWKALWWKILQASAENIGIWALRIQHIPVVIISRSTIWCMETNSACAYEQAMKLMVKWLKMYNDFIGIGILMWSENKVLKLGDEFKYCETQERFGRDSNCVPFGMSLSLWWSSYMKEELWFSSVVLFKLLNAKLSCCFDVVARDSLII